MNATRIDAVLSAMSADELRDAHWLIDVFEQWSMPADEADEWRRRIVAYHQLLTMPACVSAH